jgi:nucleotide-binding universal stress UspA family protein
MLRSILIGLDGSAYSTAALELGLRWAGQFEATLVGLGIIDEPDIRRPEPVPIGGSSFKQHRDEALVADARRRVEQFLETFTRRCTEAGVVSKVLQDVGLPHEQIVLEAQRFDLILLGQRTYFHFETQEGPDETLHKVLKHSPRPVVTVPERLGQGEAVIVAYDGSLQAARAVYAFTASGLAMKSPVHVISVHKDQDEAARQASRAVEFLTPHGIQALAVPLASSGRPADVLREQAHKRDARLLVMGAYGKSLLHDFFFGSVTRALLKENPVPLLLFH